MRVRLIALAMLSGVLAGGCGAGADPATVEQAATATRRAHTAHVGWKVTTKGFGLPSRVTVRGRGTTSLDDARMRASFDVAPVLALAGARAAGDQAQVVVRGKDLYVRPPRVRGFRLPRGARWIALDLARALRATGAEVAGLAEVLTVDPGAQIDALQAAEEVEEVGSERVGGTPTTRYRGQLDLAAYARRLPAERRRRAERAIAEFAGTGRQAQPFEVWIDGEDRVRRMTQTSQVAGQPGVPRGEVGITMELSGFGAPLDADAPAPGETYDATTTVSDALAAAPAR